MQEQLQHKSKDKAAAKARAKAAAGKKWSRQKFSIEEDGKQLEEVGDYW